jgi:hypothetical protein
MPQSMPQVWEVETAAHAEAVAQFATTVRAIPVPRWQQPLATGKWSPAEIAAHVTEVYLVLHREVVGGTGMQVRGSQFCHACSVVTLFRQGCGHRWRLDL